MVKMKLRKADWMSLGRTAVLLALAAVSGALSGAAAAFVVTPAQVVVSPGPNTTSTTPGPTATSTGPSLELVPLEPRLATPLVPPAFVARRASPVAAVYRKARGATLEDRTLSDDRLLGQAVALTSDGWFVTTGSALGQLAIAEMTIWHGDRAYVVERAVADSINGVVFVKVQATDLTPPAFGDAADLVSGSEMWLERRARSLAPTLVTHLSSGIPNGEAISSEAASRRILLEGAAGIGDRGAPAWNARGALVGLIESKPDEQLRIVPATSIASSFGSLLSSGEIRHAVLGIRGIDLAAWRIDGDRGNLPARGVMLQDDRKTGRLAVAKGSPAAAAGLRAGDVITIVERDILDGTADLGEILSEYRPSTRITLRVRRGDEEIDIPVTLGSQVTGSALK